MQSVKSIITRHIHKPQHKQTNLSTDHDLLTEQRLPNPSPTITQATNTGQEFKALTTTLAINTDTSFHDDPSDKRNMALAPQFSLEQRNFLMLEYYKYKNTRNFIPIIIAAFQTKFPNCRAPHRNTLGNILKKQTNLRLMEQMINFYGEKFYQRNLKLRLKVKVNTKEL